MTPNFDEATALVPDDETPVGPDTDEVLWHGHMTNDWSIGAVPNGGYTSAIVVRALLAHTGAQRPASLTTHYQRPTIADAPLTVRTRVIRRGRSMTHGEAVFVQDDKTRAHSIAVLGDYATDDVLFARTPPTIPSAEDCEPRDPKSQGLDMTLMQSLDIRVDSPNKADSRPGSSRFDCWVRFRDDRPNDELALALMVDAFPPAILAAVPTTAWVPTIEMTTHIRATAAPGWIQGEIVTDDVRGGEIVEDVRLWDSTGALVAEARQIALLRTN